MQKTFSEKLFPHKVVNTTSNTIQNSILDDRTECLHIKPADNVRLRGEVDMLESTLQRHLNGLEDFASKSFMRLGKDKWNVLHRGWNNPQWQYRLRYGSTEMPLEVLVDRKMKWCGRTARKANHVLGCVYKCKSSKYRCMISPLVT